MSESGDLTMLMTITQASVYLVSLVCNVLMVVVMATVVRRHRPDAHGSLLGWAVASLVLGVVTPAITFLAMRVGAQSGTSGVVRMQAYLALAGVPLHIGLFAMFVRGVVRLAQPPPRVEVERNPPYR